MLTQLAFRQAECGTHLDVCDQRKEHIRICSWFRGSTVNTGTTYPGAPAECVGVDLEARPCGDVGAGDSHDDAAAVIELAEVVQIGEHLGDRVGRVGVDEQHHSLGALLEDGPHEVEAPLAGDAVQANLLLAFDRISP